MSSPLLSLTDLVELDPAGTDRFTTVRCPASVQRFLGSGILATGLLAAAATVDAGLVPASMHATFLRGGRTADRLDVLVDRLQDGRTTSTRSVALRQGEATIATATVRFVDAHDDPGWHRDVTPEVDVGESTPELAAMADLPILAAFDVHAATRPADGRRVIHPYWVRHREALPDDPLVHAALLAFLTDLGVSGSARPPGTPLRDRLGPVTLDHALWFHRALRVDEWLLITADSLSEAGGRALARGEVATADGRLVASFAQEAMLVRPAR